MDAELTFDFVQELPKREKSRWEKVRDLWTAAKAKGPLVPVTLAARLADVSRQRIYGLIDQGKLERVELEGHVFVTEDSLVTWLQAPEDKGGRPPKSLKQIWDASYDYAKEICGQPHKK